MIIRSSTRKSRLQYVIAQHYDAAATPEKEEARLCVAIEKTQSRTDVFESEGARWKDEETR